jgi:hypothetical protein
LKLNQPISSIFNNSFGQFQDVFAKLTNFAKMFKLTFAGGRSFQPGLDGIVQSGFVGKCAKCAIVFVPSSAAFVPNGALQTAIVFNHNWRI